MMDVNLIFNMGKSLVNIIGEINDLIIISLFRLIEIYEIDEDDAIENAVGITEQIAAMEMDLA